MFLLIGSYLVMIIAQTKGPEIIGLLWGLEAKQHAILLASSESVQPTLTMEELCKGYIAAHYDDWSNVFHKAGMIATLFLFIRIILVDLPPLLLVPRTKTLSVAATLLQILLWIPPIYYLPAWFGHYIFQKDIPAVFTYGTTVQGWLMGESCAWIDFIESSIISINNTSGSGDLTILHFVTTIILSYLLFNLGLTSTSSTINNTKTTTTTSPAAASSSSAAKAAATRGGDCTTTTTITKKKDQ